MIERQRGETAGSDSDDDSNSVLSASLSYRTPVLPKALPDLDDVAMTHVFQYINLSKQDLYWSFLSDSFFVVGGILYVVLSLWDCIPRQQQTLLHKLLDILAPTVYLLNSIVDVQWAYQVKQRLGARKAVTETWNDWRLLLDMDDNDGETDVQDDPCLTWYHRLRKHGAHRRTIIAAFVFGLSAVFGLAAALLDGRNDHWASVADSISICSYFVSAAFACSGKRTRPWLQANSVHLGDDPERLEDMGDLLFLLGSLVDGVLSVLRLDDANPAWGVLSSILWLADACFYLRSDFIMHGRLQCQHVEGSALV